MHHKFRSFTLWILKLTLSNNNSLVLTESFRSCLYQKHFITYNKSFFLQICCNVIPTLQTNYTQNFNRANKTTIQQLLSNWFTYSQQLHVLARLKESYYSIRVLYIKSKRSWRLKYSPPRVLSFMWVRRLSLSIGQMLTSF